MDNVIKIQKFELTKMNEKNKVRAKLFKREMGQTVVTNTYSVVIHMLGKKREEKTHSKSSWLSNVGRS